MKKVKYVILGAGTSGLTALGQIQKETDDYLIINGGPLGTTCARVGCMPSKAMIYSANTFFKRQNFSEFGIAGAEALQVDQKQVMQRVRRLRDRFTGGVTAGSTDKLDEEHFIDGYAKFVGPNQIEVNGEQIEAERFIIATGSRPVIPAPWKSLGDKLITSDEIFELETLPKSIAVIGLGVIGLELGQALSRLGVEVHGFEMSETLGGLASPKAISEAKKLFGQEFNMYFGSAAELEVTSDGVKVTAANQEVLVEKVLASLGRMPNIDKLDLSKADLELNNRGMPEFDIHSMQIMDKPIFIAGDVNAYRPILHEAGHEAKIATLNAIEYPNVNKYQRKTSLGIAFTDPDIAMFGESFTQLDADSIEIVDFNLERNNGRAIVMHEDHGVIVLWACKKTKKLLGGELVMPHAEHFAHLLAWAVEQELTVLDLVKMPYYHPVLEEAVQGAIHGLFSKLYSKQERGFQAELTRL